MIPDIMRVYMTAGLHKEVVAGMKKRYEVEAYEGPLPIPRNALLEGVRKADGLVCFPFDRIDAEIIDAAPGLRTISTYSVGYDHIDVGRAKNGGIKIGYTPDVLTDATADLTICLMLDVTRRVTEGDRMIRKGRWQSVIGAHEYVGMGLQGRTLGIIGMGRIGRAVASRATAFGMKIIYHNRGRVKCSYEHVELEELVARSDVISLHVPHTPHTDNMIHSGIIRMMRPTAYLINTSRGAMVNERDLAGALKKGVISGAGLDVFDSEPIGNSHLLAGLENVVLSPHIGSATAETRLRMAEITAENLRLGLEGPEPAYSVW